MTSADLYCSEQNRRCLHIYTNSYKYLQLIVLEIALLAKKGKENIFVDLQQFTSKQGKNLSLISQQHKMYLQDNRSFVL